jgi:hypothetical protein
VGRVTEDELDEYAAGLVHKLNRIMYAETVRELAGFKKGKALHRALSNAVLNSGLSRAECREIVSRFKENPRTQGGEH